MHFEYDYSDMIRIRNPTNNYLIHVKLLRGRWKHEPYVNPQAGIRTRVAFDWIWICGQDPDPTFFQQNIRTRNPANN